MKYPTYSLPSLINHHARTRPEHLAYSTPHHSITFADLATRTYRLAAHLSRNVGVEPVAIILPRCIEFVETILAITRASCIGVPLDPRSSTSEIQWALRDCGAHVIFTNAGGLDKVSAALEDVAGVVIVAVDASQDDLAKRKAGEIVQYEDWAQGEVSNKTDEQVNRLDRLGLDEPAWLHYTSGTTGRPKGVLSSQRAWVVSSTNYAEALGITSADTLLWPLPLFHAFGHSLCIIGSMVVGTSVYLTGHSQGVLASVLACDKVTIIAGVPSTYQEMAMELGLAEKERKEIRLPHPRLCICAGGTTPATVKRHTKAMFGVSLLNNYGSTEACGPIAITGPPKVHTDFEDIFDIPLLSRYGCTESCGAIVADTPGDTYRDSSCGTPLPHLEMRIANVDTTRETCEPVVDGIEGEICIRGPSMLLQYWSRESQPEAPFTDEGWYRTGDLGRRLPSSGGHIAVTGRLNELIRRGSETIHPAEVERVLRSCFGVEDVVVSGLPHSVFGEIVAAYIVRTPQHAEIDPILLLSACRAVLPDFKTPTMFFEIESLPRTRAGKLKRRSVLECRCRPLHARLDLKQHTMLALVLGEIRGICELGPEERLDVNLPFVEFGMNSLAGVVLCDRLASLTGLDRLPITLIYDHPTPLAMSDYLYRQLLDRASDPRQNAPHLQRPPTEISTPSPNDHTSDPIAIISMACRYPDSISSPGDLWDVVKTDTDATSNFPMDRGWDLDSLTNSDDSDSRPGKCATNRGGFLTDMADFDIAPFHISPREALATDPQQRLLLETTWQLVERARMAPSALRGSNTGVFVGLMYSDYAGRFLNDDAQALDSHLSLGSAGSVAAGRISYTFGLNGPSMAIDTACSSSIVATDLATKSLRSGECDLAIAGGVAVMATPRPFVMFSRQGGLAPDGRCKSYSASADGTAWSEGVGLLMLERLSDAQKNGHQVLGLIRGSAVNSDGASNGLTAPSAAAQERVIWQALVNAGVGPDEVDVLEGHGTATTLGDAIETQAVATVYGQHQREFPLLLGSVKSNIGHTQAAAGVAGIIKMVEAMKHGIVPSTLHVDKPSPHIANGGRVALAIEKVSWPRRSQGGPRRAAVSSFGIGGTNSHIILEGYVEDTPQCATISRLQPSEDIAQEAYPWILSGANEVAMRAQAKALLDHRRQRQGTAVDTAFSLATTRSALTHRAAVLSRGACIDSALRSLAQNHPHPDIISGVVLGTSPQLTFMFPGQASLREHSISDIKRLCTYFPAFDTAFHDICQELDPQLAVPLSQVMDQEFENLIKHTDLSQAVIFAVEVALFRLLESFGVHPNAVVGHSVGEIAAAHCAGYLSLESAALLITTRGKLMGSLPSRRGAMASISASEEDVKSALIDLAGNEAVCSIAAVNARKSVVVSGTVEAVSIIMDVFASRGDAVSLLKGVTHAFHSPCMDSISEKLIEALSRDSTSLRPAQDSKKITMVSTVSGQIVDTSQLMAPAYWADQLRATVRFADAVEELAAVGSPVFLEIGPSAPLSTHVPNSIATHGSVDTIHEALARLWVCGVQMKWDVIYMCSGARAIDLPIYQFQKRRYWLDPPKRPVAMQNDISTYDRGMALDHPILRDITSVPGLPDTILCHGYLSLDTLPWLADHVVGTQCIVPATVLADLALSAGRECLRTRPTLEELVVTKPLILTADDSVKIQVVIKTDSASGVDDRGVPHSVDVYSRPQNAEFGRAWAQHATGIIKRFGTLSSPVKQEPVKTWQEVDMDIEGAYGALSDAADMRYGPIFQCVRAIWRSQDGSCLRAKLQFSSRIPSPHLASSFDIHPALMDAALHVRALLSTAVKSTVGLLPRLPYVLKGVQILQNHSDQATIFVRIPNGDSAGADGNFSVLLEDQAGDLIAIVKKVITRPWKPNPRAADLFDLEWTPLIIGITQNTSSSQASQDALDTVVQMWDINNPHHNSSLPDKVYTATAQVLNTIQQWSVEENFAAGGRLIIVTEKASNPDPDLISAAVWGLVRSAQAEFDLGRLVLVDLDGKVDSLVALPRALASKHGLVAIRNGQVMTPRLSKCEDVSSQISPITVAIPSPVNVSGTVLITGGTGALGSLLARHLIQTYKAKTLVLLSRSGLDAPDAKKLFADLFSLGATVNILACDVSDRGQLEAVFAGTESPVTAIVHAAGVLDDSILSTQTARRISKVLQPKVNGAWILHELAPREAQFFLFSSAAGLLGNPGQAGYAASNCFLDALAKYRRTSGLHGLSLAWGPWENRRGMAAGTTREGTLMALSDGQALAAFDAAVRLNKGEALLIPLLMRRGDVDHLPLLTAQQGPSLAMTLNKSGAHSVWKKQLAISKSQKDRAVALHDLVRNEVALVLGYQPEDTLPKSPFIELGMDSFTAVQLRNRLSVLSGLKGLPATLAFDTTSLPALVEDLLARLDEDAGHKGPAQVALPRAQNRDKPTSSQQLRPSTSIHQTQGIRLPGLSSLFRSVYQAGQFNAAAHILAAASLTLPKFTPSTLPEPRTPCRLSIGSDSNPSVLVIPDFNPTVGEGVSRYAHLAAALGSDYDIYELPHPIVLVPDSLAALAEAHAATIHELFSNKAVVLVGFSAGGCVAHAVAHRLSTKKAGFVVGLVLLDTYALVSKNNVPDWLMRLALSAAGIAVHTESDPEADAHLATMGAYLGIVAGWRPEPLPTRLRTLFLRATQAVASSDQDWRPAEWPLANKVVEVPGHHLAILDRRNAVAVAAAIRNWIVAETTHNSAVAIQFGEN